MDKLIVDTKEVDELRFDLHIGYTVEIFMKALTERLKETSAEYIEFSCNTDDANEIYMTLSTGREETDDEYNERMLREQSYRDAAILNQEKNEYIKFLLLKAKFENK